MKAWIIVSIILGILIIASVAVVSGLSKVDSYDDSVVQTSTSQDTNTASCGSCPYKDTNGCTAQNNCGQASCGAVSGSGTCGCRNR